MYKVLDVRETVNGPHTRDIYVVIIAIDIQYGERKRFVFRTPTIDVCLARKDYEGCTGEYDVLVKGDYFIIEHTDTWDNVRIICEEDVPNVINS